MSGKTAILYTRVSTAEQIKGYSLRQQLEALREYASREGYEVLAEVEDPGEGSDYLERPGLDRVRDLVEAGGVGLVVAQDADRITREPMHRFILDEEAGRHGCRWVALDDWGDDSHEGELLKFMKGWQAKGERLKTAERSRRGLNKKLREGSIIRGKRAPYGFAYTPDGNSLVLAAEMAVVRAIFGMIGAEGATLGEVVRRLTAGGVLAPSGLRPDGTPYKWQRTTLRNMVKNDLYRPLSVEEVAEQVPPQVARGLDPERLYGLWTFNKKRGTKQHERTESGGYRKGYKHEPRPREEWGIVPVDISAAGLERGVVDSARERLAQNGRRPPSTVAERFWQLSGGVLRCAVCGSALSPHTTKRWNKTNTYYRCNQRYNSGPRDCTNTCHMPAPALEEAVWEKVLGIVSDRERLLGQYEEYLERTRRQMRGDPDREAADLAGRLEKLDLKESYLLDVAADTAMPKERLRAKLEELEEQRRATREALREAHSRQEALRQPKINMAHLDSLLLQMNRMDLHMASPQDRRRIYGALRLRADLDEDRTVRLSGIFDPELYLPNLLQDPPEWLAPIPDTKGIVVTLDTPFRAT